MKNYFETQRVKWRTWNPNQIIFKSNQLIKKLMPEDNILSWTSKGDRDRQMCELTGCKATSHSYNGKPYNYYTKENYKGVMVQLKDVKSEFPSANIDFIDCTHRKDSVGNNVGSLDVLVYLNSYHAEWTYVRCPNTGSYTRQPSGNSAPIEEGYRMCYGGQGDSNSMPFHEFQELIQITEAVKNFLVEVLIPAKNGEYDYSELMVA
tara:strand:- start:406 stop:1023 length:618 start_codon:yes stop_codon:yes gene_type:complete